MDVTIWHLSLVLEPGGTGFWLRPEHVPVEIWQGRECSWILERLRFT